MNLTVEQRMECFRQSLLDSLNLYKLAIEYQGVDDDGDHVFSLIPEEDLED